LVKEQCLQFGDKLSDKKGKDVSPLMQLDGP